MTFGTDNAWLLHKRWSGESSARVTLFTREQGLVQANYKGGRTPRKQALLQPFIPLCVSWVKRREFVYIQQLDGLLPPLRLTGSSLFSALYVTELLYHVLRAEDPDEGLYDLYTRTVRALETVGERTTLEALLRRFESTLLSASGLAMSFTEEFASQHPIAVEKYYRLIPGAGFVMASEGLPGAHLLDIAADKLESQAVLNTAKWVMRRAIDHALDGKMIQTRLLYKSNK